jgi:hypothetical protein
MPDSQHDLLMRTGDAEAASKPTRRHRARPRLHLFHRRRHDHPQHS